MTVLTQANLDKHQKAVSRAIKALDAAAKAGDAGADELCAAGSFSASRDLGLVAAELRMAAAHADRAYRLARALEIPGGDGMIRPQFGGDK